MPTYNVGVAETYTTITLALAAIPADLSGTGVHEVVIEKATYNETIEIEKQNGSVTDYVYAHAKAGDEHKGIPGSGVVINGNFRLKSEYSWVSDLEGISNSSSFSTGTGVSTDGSNSRIERCIGREITNYFYNFTAGSGTTDSVFINCVGLGGGSGHYCFRDYSGTSNFAYNCVARSGTRGFSGFTTYNCASTATNPFADSIGDYNASSNASAPGANSLHNVTDEQFGFVDWVNGNFHVNNTSVLLGAGTSQSPLYNKDIDLEIIDTANWPIGIDYHVPTCWTYTARYKNSKRLFRLDGPGVYPTSLKVPSNVDVSTGQMVDEGQLIDPSKYSIN